METWKIAEALDGRDHFLVIDAGWYRQDPVKAGRTAGTGFRRKQIIPQGLKAPADIIRPAG